MSANEIIMLVILGISVLASLIGIIVATVRGDMKKFIVAKMEEAELIYKDDPDKAKKKLNYVIEAVKEKYKLVELILNIRKFVEYIIDISKHINTK